MKLPIPNDWDGTSWQCVQVQWPDSQQYTGVLLGLLSLLTRGRLWDEQTGTITDAQAVGWQIFNANYPLVPCAGEDNQNGAPQPQNGLLQAFGTCSADDMEDDGMGQVVTSVSIVDGKLRVEYGKCCVEEFALSTSLAGQATDIGDDPLNPHNDTLTYYPCGKAWNVVETLYAVAEIIWDQLDQAPLFWVRNVKNAFPDLELTDEDIITAVLYAADILALGTVINAFGESRPAEDATFDVSTKQQILCQVEEIMTADSTGMSSAQYSAFKDAVAGQWGFNLLERYFWTFSLDAVGRGDFDNVAKLGGLDNTHNCDCPAVQGAEPFFQYGLDKAWRYVYDFRTGANGFTLGSLTHQDATGLWADNQVSDHIAPIAAELPFDNVNNGSVIELIGLIWQNVGDENYMTSGTDVGTDANEFIDQPEIADLGGNNPANAGTFTFIVSTSTALGVGSTEFHANLQAEHLTDVSQKLIAVMFAGSGPGPMA